MNLRKETGITMIALIITIILMLILAGVGVYYGGNALERAKTEDIKTNMISIKTKAKIVAEEYNFKDIENLVGTKLDQNEEQDGIQTDYNISQDLKSKLEALYINNIYVWSNEDLQNQHLSTINVNDEAFYIVCYNLTDTNQCEIYYSKGIDGKYSLSELQS